MSTTLQRYLAGAGSIIDLMPQAEPDKLPVFPRPRNRSAFAAYVKAFLDVMGEQRSEAVQGMHDARTGAFGGFADAMREQRKQFSGAQRAMMTEMVEAHGEASRQFRDEFAAMMRVSASTDRGGAGKGGDALATQAPPPSVADQQGDGDAE